MEVAEVGASLVVGYIGCCLAIGFHWDATPYFVLRSHAFILTGDIAFVTHAWFVHGVTQTWWCLHFHGQGEQIVSPPPKVGLVLSLTLKNIGVGQSDPLVPKIHQNTEGLKFSIGQNNLNGKFGSNPASHDMPLQDSPRNESHRSVKGVPEVYFFRRRILWALLQTSGPYSASFPPLSPLPPPPLSPPTPLPPPPPSLPAQPLGLPPLDLPQTAQWVSLHGELGFHVQRVLLVTPESIRQSINVCLRCFPFLEHGTQMEGGGLDPGSAVFFAAGLG